MARAVEDLVGRAELCLRPCVHHHDAIGDAGDDSQVVCDEDERRTRPLSHALEHLEYLCLDRDVEGGGGLVGDEDVGVVG
jgi:hypothetical protein